MRLLLDTHALLWWFTDDSRLSANARAAIADERNEVCVSSASAWEIATKVRLGKLETLPRVVERFAELIAADGFETLPIVLTHALRAGTYAQTHRDPFDRILAAQSELESMMLVTVDPAFVEFHSKTLW